MDYWIEQIKTNSQEFTKMVLFGNKCDLIEDRKVTKEEGEEYANNNKIKFFEVSAKDGTNVNKAFEFFIKDILNCYSPTDNTKKRRSKILSAPIEIPKKSSCC